MPRRLSRPLLLMVSVWVVALGPTALAATHVPPARKHAVAKKQPAKKKAVKKKAAACPPSAAPKHPVVKQKAATKKKTTTRSKRPAHKAAAASAHPPAKYHHPAKKTKTKAKPKKKAVAKPCVKAKAKAPALPPAPAPSRPAAPPAPPSIPPQPAAQSGADLAAQALLDGVTRSHSTADAVAATTTLLKAAGVGVPDDTQPSPDGLQLTPAMVLAVTQDTIARSSGGRISLLDLADLLDEAQLGTPTSDSNGGGFEGHPIETAARLETMLATWLSLAEQDPGGADAEPILLLARLAASQDPPIDLARPGYGADQLELGHLDLTLLIGGLGRIAPAFLGDRPAPSRARAASADPPPSATPCSDMKTTLEKAVPLAGGSWGYAVGKVGQESVNQYAQLYLLFLGEGDRAKATQKVGAAVSILGLLAKVQSLVELYQFSTASILPGGGRTLDRPGPGDPDSLADVTVHAGVQDAIWQDFAAQRDAALSNLRLRDCLNLLGLPTNTNVGDIGASVSTWRAAWTLTGSDGAQISLAHNHFDQAPLKKYLAPFDDHSGLSSLTVDAVPEAHAHASGDKLVHDRGVVKVSVQTDTPPNITTFLSAADVTDPFGAPAAVLDILLKMFQAVDTFDAQATVDVVRHEPSAARWTGTAEQTTAYDFSSHSAKDYTQPDSNPVISEHVVSNERKTVKTASSAEILGVDSQSLGDQGDSWSLSARGLSSLSDVDVTSTARHGTSAHGDGHGGTVACSFASLDTGNLDRHGSFSSGAETLPASISVSRDGTWSASGVFAGYDTEIHGQGSSHGSVVDECYSPKGYDSDQTAPGDHVMGDGWEVSGTFDPANPPSTLHAEKTYPDDPNHRRLVVDLDYHAPVLGPPPDPPDPNAP